MVYPRLSSILAISFHHEAIFKKMRKTFFIFFLFTAVYFSASSQATIGLIQENSAEDGYELFAPIRADTTYLIDKCGRRIHQWASPDMPGLSVYLLPDGSLLRAGNVPNNTFRGTGEQGGKIEKYDWNNNLLWSYTISSDSETQNHDIYPLANGNVLVIVWEAIGSNIAVAAGRNPALLLSTLYSAKIEELQPVGTNQANIVWQWRLWDHLIQDFDSTKSNYGVVADHPELVNLNAVGSNVATKDWIHPNAIAYNATLDQVLLSAHNLSEFWIIDHSTTTAQATTHAGGVHNKGGDLLYRWGNPQVYNRGNAADEVFYTQHSSYWIPDGYPYAGSIMTFNNGANRPGGNASSVDIVTPPVDSNGDYAIAAGQPYGPTSLAWTYQSTPPDSFYSSVMGSGQMLPNGNVVICEATSGNFFEVDSNKNVLWRYINPVNADTILTQGSSAPNNGSFRCTQYAPSYTAFTGDSLIPEGHIEKNPIFTACDSSTITTGIVTLSNSADILLYPNPATDKITVELHPSNNAAYSIMDLCGRIVESGYGTGNIFEIPLAAQVNGAYVVQITTGGQKIQQEIIINR